MTIFSEPCRNPFPLLTHVCSYFRRGKGGTDKKEHEINLELFGEVKPEESKYVVRGRGTELVLIKENQDAYWKRLFKEDKKHHWLKIDFGKWKDEDESDEEAGDAPGGGGPGGPGQGADFEEMMRQMGGLGGGGMGGMPGMGGMGGMMGGMPGMGGMGAMGGMPDFGDLEGEEGKDSDDEELPDLEEAK